jgi:hypothetical protein
MSSDNMSDLRKRLTIYLKSREPHPSVDESALSQTMIELNTENETLPTIWTVPDDLWEMVQCLSDRFDLPNRTGRKRIDARRALNGMMCRMPLSIVKGPHLSFHSGILSESFHSNSRR